MVRTRASSPVGVYGDRVNLYVQLARTFRDRIALGTWKPGRQIPTILQLCAEFKVSRPPVRQAIAILVSDGLLESTQGRGTFVSEGVIRPSMDDSVRLSISDPLAMGGNQKITVLSRSVMKRLPQEIQIEEPQYESYACITKTHASGLTPFSVMRVFVAEKLYAMVPRGRDTKEKLASLLRKHARVRPIGYRQEITVVHATEGWIFDALAIPRAEHCVRVRRWWIDSDSRLALASLGFYRTDMFALDVSIRDAGADLFSFVSPEKELHFDTNG